MPFSLRLKPGRNSTPVAAPSGEGINHGSTSEPLPADSTHPSTSAGITTTSLHGLKVWYDPQDATVDIYFIHGLTGDRDSTWIARGQTEPWPKTLLVSEILKARLISYGYNANAIYESVASQSQLNDQAISLLTAINDDWELHSVSNRHIIFVAHSFGGLLCERVLLLSHLRYLFGSIIGVVFMGAFHQDAWLANRTKLSLSPLGRSNLTNRLAVRNFSQGEEFLKAVKEDFSSTLRWEHRSARDLFVMCSYEKIPVLGIGEADFKKSAVFAGLTPVSILTSRSDIVRFRSLNDASFRRFSGELDRLIKQRELKEYRNRNCGPIQRSIDTTTLKATINRNHTPYYYLPLKRDGNFTFIGRGSLLSSLRERIFARNHIREFALCGLAGIGKTQTAWQLVMWTKYNKPDYSIIWLSALSGASLARQCAEIVSELGLKVSTEYEKPIDTVKRYMSSKASGRWLLIIDDVDNEETAFGSDGMSGIYTSLPESDFGFTLCITFSKEIASKLATKENIFELPAMPREHAFLLLNQALGEDPIDDNWAAKTLLVRLAFLPLAIKQAASYITSTRTTITSYLGLLDGVKQESIDFLNQDVRATSQYRESLRVVAATFLVSFCHILNKDAMATKLLNLLACIEPGAISLAMLSELHSNVKFELVVGTLCDYGFLVQRDDGEMFDMHRLIHLAIRKRIDQSNSTIFMIDLAARYLRNLCMKTPRRPCHVWRSYLPHMLKLLQGRTATESDKTVPLLCSASQYLLWDNRFIETVALLERANTHDRKIRLKNDTCWLVTQHNLAIACRMVKEYDKALQVLAYVLSCEKYPERLDAQQMLAETYMSMGRIDDAVLLFQKVVSIKRKTLSQIDIGRMRCELGLARAFLAVQRNKEALKILESMVSIPLITVAEYGSIRLTSQYHLARTYLRLKRFKEAVGMFKNVISAESRRLSEDHPSRLETQCELASAYSDMGLYRKAADLLVYIVSVKRKTLPENHSSLLSSQVALAYTYAFMQSHQKAADLLECVIAIKQRSLPVADLELLALQCHLALIYDMLNRHEEAVDMLERVVLMGRQTLPQDNEDLLFYQSMLSQSCSYANRREEAISLLEHILLIAQNKFPVDHQTRLEIEDQLAKIYNKGRLYQKAINFLEEVIPLRENILIEGHPNLLASQFELSSAYGYVERIQDAIKLLKHVVSVKRRKPKAYDDLQMNEIFLECFLMEQKSNSRPTEPSSASQNHKDENSRVDNPAQTKERNQIQESDQTKQKTQADEDDGIRGADQTNEGNNTERLIKLLCGDRRKGKLPTQIEDINQE